MATSPVPVEPLLLMTAFLLVLPLAACGNSGELDPCDGAASSPVAWFADGDGDGHGGGDPLMACTAPQGHVAADGDCDDTDPQVHPAAAETCRDETDRNCDGFVDYVPWPVTCEVHLVEQGQFSSFDLEGTGLVVGSVSVHGSSLKAARGTTLEEFLDFEYEEIRSRFETYLSNLGPYAEDTVFILDIEHPVHPRKFWTYLGTEDFEAIIAAFQLRIQVARDLLPGHPLGLYGTVVPQPRGNPEVFADWFSGYEAAGDLGLYDDLDYLVPVIYHRLALDDPDLAVDRAAAAHQALSAASSLRRTDGTALELFPLLGLKMGGNLDDEDDPSDDFEAPTPEGVDHLVEILLMYEQVGVIGFWTGSDTSATVQPDIPTWFESVTMVPVPDCTCPE